MKRIPLLLAIGLVVLTLVVGFAPAVGGRPGASPGTAAASLSTKPGAPQDGASPSPTPTSSAEAAPADSLPPSASPSPTPAERELADVAVVPVTQFRSTLGAVTLAETKATIAGTSKRFAALELVEGEATAILDALGLEGPAAGSTRLVLAADSDALAADLAAHRDRLAFVRADAVGPGVRALAWGKDDLFGVGRLRTWRTGR